jgi:VanZ family protein
MRRAVLRWFPFVAWAAVIFAFSAQPNLRFAADDVLDLVIRKIGHMGVFGILALLAWYALARTTAWRRPWAWASGLAVVYAISDELHQGFVVGRHPSPVDVGIDAAGALIAIAAGLVLAHRLR